MNLFKRIFDPAESVKIMKQKKVAILGVGHVGAHAASALCTQGIADEVVLIDANTQKITSEAQDLNDALLYTPFAVNVHPGDFNDLADCDILIHSVGDIELLRGSEERSLELDFNIRAVYENAKKIKDSGFQGIIINISNPCDVITRALSIHTGLPQNHVFGTGTALDSSRLIGALSRQTGIAKSSISAMMLGEHGNRQFAPRSVVSFHGAPLEDAVLTALSMSWSEIEHEAIKGGWVTFAGKFCTEYGIAATGARLAQAVLRDEHLILPVSAPLNGEYGQSDLYAGVPAVIGRNGIEKVITLPLTESEQEEFASCCDAIRKNILKAEALEKKLKAAKQ